MAEQVEQWDSDYAIPRGSSDSISTDHSHARTGQEGYIATDYGYVYVWARQWNDGTKITRMEFIHGGRLHIRRIRDIYQPRYLVTLAKRFAAEIAGEDTT